jgi:hypothetical protein
MWSKKKGSVGRAKDICGKDRKEKLKKGEKLKIQGNKRKEKRREMTIEGTNKGTSMEYGINKGMK